MSTRPWSTPATVALVASSLLVPAREAEAQSIAPTDNAFALDLYQGTVLAPGWVTAMGGAYTGYGQGIGAYSVNAAAPAVRHTHSTDWFELDVDASLSFPLVLVGNDDVDNSGGSDFDYQGYVYLAGGVNVQLGNLGFGFFGDVQRYSVTFPPSEAATIVTIGRYHLLAAYQLFGGQLVLGGGARAHSLGVSAPGKTLDPALGMFGLAPEAGFLVKPDWSPFRIGVSYRHAVKGLLGSDSGTTVDERGVRRAGGLIVPNDVAMPWELGLGVAFQVGPRPLNPRWLDPREHERELDAAHAEKLALARRRRANRLEAVPEGPERETLARGLDQEQAAEEAEAGRAVERNRARLKSERRAILNDWPREHLLVTADLLVTGPVERGVSMEAFIGQGTAPLPSPCMVVASGASVNLSPRAGLQIEPIPNRVQTRFGSYYEPTRFRYAPEACNDRVGRQHFTFGADVKAFSTRWFGLTDETTYKVQVYGDFAPRYSSIGVGLGVWY
ncbi:MAG: hypothetical protein FJ096_22460 [Deltaproteobacteria bacterium]|nr:hypothetical protein [Deltaproteobacteria bacterium]